MCFSQSNLTENVSLTPTPLSPGLCDDRNYQNQLKDVPGVRSAAHIWPLRASADPGWLSLPADVPVALRLWWEPCALLAGRDNGQLRPPLPGSCSNGAKCDWSHLWEGLRLKCNRTDIWDCHMDNKLISVQMMLCNVCMHSQLLSIKKEVKPNDFSSVLYILVLRNV